MKTTSANPRSATVPGRSNMPAAPDAGASTLALIVAVALLVAIILNFFTAPAPAAEGTLVRINNIAQAVSAPLVTNVTTSVLTLFSTNTAEFNGRTILRTVQNVGTVAMLYSINNTNVTTNSFHGILAGGTAARDGLGSVLDLSNIPFPVSFVTESSTGVLAIVELTQ